MDPGTTQVAALIAVLAVSLGPVLALIGLLNLRDRRRARLLEVACAQFPPEAIRSDVAIRVHCALFSRRAEVNVDMRFCSREAIWEAMTRLRRTLPASVQLRVEGRIDRRTPARFTVDAMGTGRDLAAVEVGGRAAG